MMLCNEYSGFNTHLYGCMVHCGCYAGDEVSKLAVRSSLSKYEFSWARLVSDVLSPPVVWAALSFPIAGHVASTSGQMLLWASIYSIFVCLIPVLFIAYMVKRGRITDIHVRVRRQRILPFVVSIICTSFAVTLELIVGAPPLVPMFALFSLLQMAIMLIITTFWQISMHAMGITSAVMAIGALFGVGIGLLFTPLIVVVGAARIKLRRHTLPQVVAGALVGGSMTALLFALVSP